MNQKQTNKTASISQNDRNAYDKAKRQIAKSIKDNQHLIQNPTAENCEAPGVAVPGIAREITEELAAACRLAQQVIGGADTSGAGQRAAHAALFVALANYNAANI